jgi:hypothetical protein
MYEVVRLMAERNIGAVVAERHQVVGIVSDRDDARKARLSPVSPAGR